MKPIIYFTLISLLIPFTTWPAESYQVYNKNEKKGSEYYFNPVSYYFNIAFDVTRNPFYFYQRNTVTNHKIFLKRIENPPEGIRKNGGYKHFARTEIYGLRASPNYSLHLIGGGYDFRRLEQWYGSHAYKHSYALALATSLLATFGNEALETTNPVVQATDHIADVFVFDIAGRVLFLQPGVLEFFHGDLGLRNWPNQAMFSVDDGKIFNAGTNYIIRPNLFHSDVRPFIYATLGFMTGVSYSMNSTDSISVGTGMGFTDAINFKGYWQTGIFYDEDGSLISSLFINTVDNLKLQYNLFPGILKFGGLDIGMMVGIDRDEHPVVGVNLLSLPGVGYKDFN